MGYRNLTPKEFSKAVNVLEIVFWLFFSLFTALWWLPEYLGEDHPLTMRHGIMFFGILWVCFLQPITQFGFTNLRVGYKRFVNGGGGWLTLKAKVMLISIATTGFPNMVE